MKKLLLMLGVCAAMTGMNACKKVDDPLNPTQINVRTHNITINWFRDETTPNPKAFVDFYNGASYTQAEARAHETSTDAFVFDHGVGPLIFQEVCFRNMATFGLHSFYNADSFNTVVGFLPFGYYTSTLFTTADITNVDFNNLRYNSDINTLWTSKGSSGGFPDMDIPAVNLTNNMKYYEFLAANGKRGYFRVISANYQPGGTMTIEVKVEQ